jgi:arabinogalactan oligomer/maltooligosaccharide transport system permease protein
MTTGTQLPTETPVDPHKDRPGFFRRFRSSWARWWFAYAMLIPVVVVIAILVLWPLAQGFWLTFTDANAKNIGDVRNDPSYDFVGLQNYWDILSGQRKNAVGQSFWTVFVRTVIWTATNIFFHYTIGLGLAIVLNRKMKGRSLYRIILLIPWAMPAYITASSWRFLFNETAGPINIGLSIFGIPAVPWLGTPTTAFIAVIMVNVWLGVPFMMVALLGGLQGIPDELYEAADIDGASAWQKFHLVTLPLLRPVSSTVILLGTIWTFNMFVIIFLVTAGGPASSTEILVTFAYNEAFTVPARNFAIASTYGIIILSILVVFSWVYRRIVERQGDSVWS